MASKWLPLSDALKYVQSLHGISASELLLNYLRQGEISALAGIVRERKLMPLHEPLLDPDAPDEPHYIGSMERFLRVKAELASLAPGTTHLVLRGDRYTVVRDHAQATVYYDANFLLAESAREELSPNFWQDAVVDPPQSFAVSDDLRALVRTEAFQIALSRTDVSRLFPLEASEGQGSPRKTRKGKYDWPAARAEAEQFIRMRGLQGRPKEQATLEKHILQWFANQSKYPNPSHVRKHVSPILKAAQQKKPV